MCTIHIVRCFFSLSFACWSVKTRARSPMQPFVVLSRNGALPDETKNRATTRAIMGPLWLLVGHANQQEITQPALQLTHTSSRPLLEYTVWLECVSLFQASQILESGRKIDDSLRASSSIWASEAARDPGRSREARFACPNRRACLQAKLMRKNKNKNKTKQNWGETRARPSFPCFAPHFPLV